GNFVAPHKIREASDLLAVHGDCSSVDTPPGCGPAHGFRVNVEEDGPEAVTPAGSMSLGTQTEGMLDQLRSIEKVKQPRVLAKPIPDALKSGHAITPDRTPIGTAEARRLAAAKGLEALGLDADERRGCDHETVQHRVAPAAPRESNRLFER
ncbi:MAG: hypothetical protein OXP75_16685, partial [Rhodospirillales bacterium]|nr:hypothetical protein [Rhodospirillales bacterium]